MNSPVKRQERSRSRERFRAREIKISAKNDHIATALILLADFHARKPLICNGLSTCSIWRLKVDARPENIDDL